MATLEIDAKKELARDILLYCGVSEEEASKKVDNWGLTNGISGRSSTEGPLIYDVIHGPVELTPLLYEIINTSEFHRLKEIKQLGAANYVYPGANHTRFDHSIGVCYLAGQFAHVLRQKITEIVKSIPEDERHLWEFTDEEVHCTQIAGLCHDLGHGPFSHMFEHMVIQNPLLDIPSIKSLQHELLSIAIFKRLLTRNLKVLYEFVKANLGVEHVKKIEKMIYPPKCSHYKIINGIPWHDKRMFLYEIVANKQSGVDVDKWDYYTRDCYYLGVSHDFQLRRCMLLSRVTKVNGELHIAFRDKELDNFYGMFSIRCHLHQIAYQHKTSKAVERMLSDAILLVKDMSIIKVKLSNSQERVMSIQTILKEAIECAKQGSDGSKLEGYLMMTDSLIGVMKYALYQELHECKDLSENHFEAIKLLERVERRDLYYLLAKTRVPESAIDKHVLEDLSNEEIILDTILCHLVPKERIKKTDLWIQVVKFQLASESRDDPVSEIIFYEKESRRGPVPLRQLTLDMASKLIVPKAFVEYEVRIYDKRLASSRGVDDSKSLQKALNEWKNTIITFKSSD